MTTTFVCNLTYLLCKFQLHYSHCILEVCKPGVLVVQEELCTLKYGHMIVTQVLLKS